MRALMKYDAGPGNIDLRDVDIPHIEDHEVLIKIHAAGFCGSDMEIY
ncbi:MAG: hypothetical protein HY882_00970 [Deltaproteobacteria bacterium]|nr:hypothetical protein [Deltaproteobacteria bacterium]